MAYRRFVSQQTLNHFTIAMIAACTNLKPVRQQVVTKRPSILRAMDDMRQYQPELVRYTQLQIEAQDLAEQIAENERQEAAAKLLAASAGLAEQGHLYGAMYLERCIGV